MPAEASVSEMASAKLRDSKARVIADHQPFADVLVLVHVVGNRIAHPANIVEGVVVGDDASPTIGSEFDL